MMNQQKSPPKNIFNTNVTFKQSHLSLSVNIQVVAFLN